MRSKKVLILLMLLILSGVAKGQKKYPKDTFRSPVSFPISLSGSFGEVRKNHFHSGIDIRTQGEQGKPVYAIADGYVARVFVSPGGFGKAIYLAHANGYTSVYGHLRSFAGALATWVRKEQYRKESFALDTEIPEGTIRFKKGDIIAYSGNSGSSAGPHLHFEIRDSKTQEVVDPLLFGLMKPDGTIPKISFVKIYPADQDALINGLNQPLLLSVVPAGKGYALKNNDTIKVSGNIYFGIETSDQGEGGLKTGANTIRLSVDDQLVFSQHIDRFAFSETRYVNSLIDYPALIRSKHRIQRSYIAPNNRLGIYQDVKNKGVINFSGKTTHAVNYRVTDDFGNTGSLLFHVRSTPPGRALGGSDKQESSFAQVFSWKKDNRFDKSGLQLEVPGEALYEDLPFTYYTSPPVRGTYAPVHHLHDRLTPLHTYCSLSIKAERLPAALQDKAIIVSVDGAGKFISQGGSFAEGWVKTRIREFGNYSVAIDTVAPVIKPVNVFDNKKIGKQSTIQIKISDNLSGIKTYKGTLNGKWILMDYDLKKNLLVYTYDDRLLPGKNKFVLTVTDGTGNSARYAATLIR